MLFEIKFFRFLLEDTCIACIVVVLRYYRLHGKTTFFWDMTPCSLEDDGMVADVTDDCTSNLQVQFYFAKNKCVCLDNYECAS
jgi:hypothetical protein